MKKHRFGIIIVILIIIFVSFNLINRLNNEKMDRSDLTATVKITVTNESANIIKNLYISSNSHLKFKAFSDIDISKSEFMNVELPVTIEGAALLTYTDELGIDHNASIIGYLMPNNEIDVTIISADKNGLIVEVEK